LKKEKPKHKLDNFKWETYEKLMIFQFIPGFSPSEFLSQSEKAHTQGF